MTQRLVHGKCSNALSDLVLGLGQHLGQSELNLLGKNAGFVPGVVTLYRGLFVLSRATWCDVSVRSSGVRGAAGAAGVGAVVG